MSIADAKTRSMASARRDWASAGSPMLFRALIILALAAGAAAGLMASRLGVLVRTVDDADLARLLRAMAAIKALMAAGVVAGVWWRLGGSVTWSWFLAYAAAAGSMAAGVALVWSLAHLGAGALLLHGGLLASIVLLWRDPVLAARLAALVAARRAAIASRRPG
jgi:hypothetical protein